MPCDSRPCVSPPSLPLTPPSINRSVGFSPCHYPQIQLFAPSAFGNRPVRPESQPRASRTNRCSARRRTPRSETCARPPRPAPGLKGRFQRSQVRKHLVATPLNTPAGLKGRFQQSEVRKHLGEPYPTATTADVLKSALQASKPIWGCPGPRAAPWAFGNRPFRPESQTRAEQNETVAPGDRLVSWVMTRLQPGHCPQCQHPHSPA